MAERVEERRFAGVGIADQRDRAKWNSIARITPQRTLLTHFVDRLFNFRNPIANTATVGFEFLFARSPNSDAACAAARATTSAATALAAKARHRCALSSQARQHVIELREFDLKLPFAAARVLRENIENELRAIDDAALGDLFYVSLLRGREVAVENDEARFVRGRFGADFIEFAAADEGGGIGRVAHLMNRGGDLGARAAGQLDEFVERILPQFGKHVRGDALRALECHADQQNAFGCCSGVGSLHRSAGGSIGSCGFRRRSPEPRLSFQRGLYPQGRRAARAVSDR